MCFASRTHPFAFVSSSSSKSYGKKCTFPKIAVTFVRKVKNTFIEVHLAFMKKEIVMIVVNDIGDEEGEKKNEIEEEEQQGGSTEA